MGFNFAQKAILAGCLLTGLAVAATTPAIAQDKKYTIYLSNGLIGNDWLQQMQRSAEVAVKKPPLADRVDLHIETVENSAQAQINSLNNIIAAKPDAILVHAASLDALNPTIEAACAAGIVVISFSQVVTAPCPYKLNTNWDSVNHDIPVWLANVLGGKGKIIVDRGLPGSPISEASNKEIERVLAGFPEIEIVGWYTSNYALGDEQAGVASLLAANPQIDGILTAGYGTGAIQALKDAGRPLVPIVAFSYNGTATACATETEPGLKCFIYTHPPYLSAEAIKLAVEILDGHPPASKTVMGDYPRLTTDIVTGDFSPGTDLRKLEIGVNVFPDLPPGLVLPASPDWVNITADEAAGTGGSAADDRKPTGWEIDVPLLQAMGISKRYGGILALNNMHFAANAGEVHAILGENGAGKSTFIQILSGAVAADEGELRLDGAPCRPRSPREARKIGISPVFQELSLIPDLTVAENIFFGDEQLSRLGTISQRDLNEKTRALLASLGLEPMRPDAPVRALSIGDRQLIEIVKGLAGDPDILILDEATSALLPREVDWLLNKARERAARGKLVLYISHRMDEVRRVADRVTVLRNGETVGTETTAALGDDDIVAMMLGRRLDRLFPARRPTSTERIALKASNLKVGHQLRGVSFALHEGEVLGVAGLQGHGQRELFMALFGAERAEGQVEIWGKPVTIRGPGHALSPEIGMALLPEDRRSQGILPGKPVRENIVLSALKRIVRRGLIDTRAERRLVEEAVAQLHIKADSMEQLAGTLSGGNQQKVVLAKLLATEARILLFFDPTRGVDVGTKAEIFSLMRGLAERGFAILFFSTDLAELANVADRTLVMSYGTIAATLEGETMTEGAILGATLSQGAAA